MTRLAVWPRRSASEARTGMNMTTTGVLLSAALMVNAATRLSAMAGAGRPRAAR